jgi:DNA-binding response OmpR family regulator
LASIVQENTATKIIGTRGTTMRVLVVEDDPSIRETLGMVLEAFQHQPDLVSDGPSALEYLRNSWPDVMLLDLTLESMSGEEVYHAIRNEFGHVPPTVVISAAQQGEARASHLPGTMFLAKPYTIEQLAEMIEAAAVRGAA